MARLHLRPDVALRVVSRDGTHFGSPIGTRPDEETRRLFASVISHVEQHGLADLARSSPAILASAVGEPGFADVGERNGRGGWRLRDDVLYPNVAAAAPHVLHLFRPDTGDSVQARIPGGLWGPIHEVLAELSTDGHDHASPVIDEVEQLLGALIDKGFVDDGRSHDGEGTERPDLTFVGHNTVLIRSGTTRVVLDPFLRAQRATYPESYQPLTRAELGTVDAVLLTHCHPDHFDLGSLLRFDADVHVVVPAIERETVLSVAMADRLRALGFTRVTPLPWGERLRIGDIEVAALPFYGEQPAEHEVLHPEIRNEGNCYVVRTPSLSCAFVADSGRDPSGDVKEVATEWLRREGPVDVVFSGYRGWYLYPAQLLFSSVSRFLLFVPPALWGTRQQLMNGVDDALDLAERWGARWLVPYADGGAPWFWDMGLGPRLDGDGQENTLFDPFPERVVEAAGRRGRAPTGPLIHSPVEVLLLRPGDGLDFTGGTPCVVRTPGHEWPYA